MRMCRKFLGYPCLIFQTGRQFITILHMLVVTEVLCRDAGFVHTIGTDHRPAELESDHCEDDEDEAANHGGNIPR